MESNWASENLQVIRTLMESAALYRRALAPIMLGTGSVGLGAALLTRWLGINGNRPFALFWLGVSLAAVLTALVLVRRQALRDHEPFWSPPTRRVTRALAPPFFAGLFLGLLAAFLSEQLPPIAWLLSAAWVILYGCALHAAGFCMPRGIRLLGASLVFSGCLWLLGGALQPSWRAIEISHGAMGCFFGALHLAYGCYLYLTETRRDAS